jgi:rhodanese-related sulfurtransferase
MVPEIDPDELAVLLDADQDVQIVDIRSPAAFERGHIPDSDNVPLPRVPQRAPEYADADRVVTVCPHGKSSIKAARLLLSHEGISSDDVASLAGGLTAWDGEFVQQSPGTGATDGGTDQHSDGPDAPF